MESVLVSLMLCMAVLAIPATIWRVKRVSFNRRNRMLEAFQHLPYEDMYKKFEQLGLVDRCGYAFEMFCLRDTLDGNRYGYRQLALCVGSWLNSFHGEHLSDAMLYIAHQLYDSDLSEKKISKFIEDTGKRHPSVATDLSRLYKVVRSERSHADRLILEEDERDRVIVLGLKAAGVKPEKGLIEL